MKNLPREHFECAFDIIGPSKNLISDAEVIVVTDEIMREFKSTRDSQYFFRINHVKLLRGILNHFGINDHQLVHDVMRAAGINSKKARMAALSQHISGLSIWHCLGVIQQLRGPNLTQF